jgi:adenylate kinase family enzyme
MRVNEITVQSVEEGVNDPHIFKAIFLAGGPGSGKSYVSGKMTGQKSVMTGLKVVNSDDMYEYLMSRQGMDMSPENVWSDKGQETRNRAKQLTKTKEKKYIDGRLGLILDGTGKDVEKVSKQKEKLEAMGYDCMMLFINTSEEVAIQRDAQRQRSVGASAVSKMWKNVQDNIMKFQQLFGAAHFHVVDNSGGLEDLDRAANFAKVEKNIDKFINTPPRKPAAKKWIQQEKTKSLKNNTLDIGDVSVNPQ